MFNTYSSPYSRIPQSSHGNGDVLSWGVVFLILVAIISLSSMLAAVRSDVTAPPRPRRFRIDSGSYMIEPNETILPGNSTPQPVAISHIPQPTMVPNTFPDPFPSSTPPMDMGLFPGRREFGEELYIPKQT